MLLCGINYNKAYSKEDYNSIFKDIFNHNIYIREVNGLLIEKNIRALKRYPVWYSAELSPDGTKLLMHPEPDSIFDQIPVLITLADSKVVLIEPPDGLGNISSISKWDEIDPTIFYYTFVRTDFYDVWRMTTDGKAKMISRKNEDTKLVDISSDGQWLILSLESTDPDKQYKIMQSRTDEGKRIKYDSTKQGGDLAGIKYRMQAQADSFYGASILLQEIENTIRLNFIHQAVAGIIIKVRSFLPKISPFLTRPIPAS